MGLSEVFGSLAIADIGASRSICHSGLEADLGCVARSCDMLVRSTSGCRCGWAWWIGGYIMQTPNLPAIRALRPARNKGRIVGQKRPLKPKHVWAIRVRLELAENHRDLAPFQFCYRQQTARLRSRTDESRRCHGVRADSLIPMAEMAPAIQRVHDLLLDIGNEPE